MATQFHAISGVEALDALLEQSRTETVILFNHDPHCPISARAYAQMAKLDGDVVLVDVSSERQLTSAIQTRTGIRHESPQVFVLHGGEPTWSASHFAITADAVREAADTASESE